MILGAMSALRGLGIGLMIGGAATVGGALYGYHKGQAEDKQRSDLVISEMRRKPQEATDEFKRQQRERETNWARDAVGAYEARAESLARAQRMEAELRRTRTDRDGLRERLAAYAAGPTDPGEDSLSSCRERAARMGERLDAGLSVQEQLGGYVAACAATVRSLLDAWPKQATVSGD